MKCRASEWIYLFALGPLAVLVSACAFPGEAEGDQVGEVNTAERECIYTSTGDTWWSVTGEFGLDPHVHWSGVRDFNPNAGRGEVLFADVNVCLTTDERDLVLQIVAKAIPDDPLPPPSESATDALRKQLSPSTSSDGGADGQDSSEESDATTRTTHTGQSRQTTSTLPSGLCGNPYYCVQWVLPPETPKGDDTEGDGGPNDGLTSQGAGGVMSLVFRENWVRLRELYDENHLKKDVAVTIKMDAMAYAIADLRRDDYEADNRVTDHYFSFFNTLIADNTTGLVYDEFRSALSDAL